MKESFVPRILIKCLLLCQVLAGVQYGSGQEMAVLICMGNVSWEGDMEDTRREGPGSEVPALREDKFQETGREKGPDSPGVQRVTGPGTVRGLG